MGITRGKDGTFCIAEQEDEGKLAYACVRDANGAVLARMGAAMSTASASTHAATFTSD